MVVPSNANELYTKIEENKKFTDSAKWIQDGFIVSDNIETCRKFGNAITVLPSADALCRSKDGLVSEEFAERSELWRPQTPQAVPLGTLVRAHEAALARGWTNIVATFALLIKLGIPIHFSRGSETNVKITTRGDLSIFKALLALERKGDLED